MARNPFIFGGVEYDLAHLEPFTVRVPSIDPARSDAQILVTFSHHVFSKKWDANVCDPQAWFEENGEARAFCAQRHGWSLALPAVIKYHVNGRAYETRDTQGRRRHAFVTTLQGSAVPYPVFFALQRASRNHAADGILTVASAYEKPKLPKLSKLQNIKFGRLVGQRVGYKQK